MSLSNQRVAYFNGKIVPESDVLISFRDRGFLYGDAVFDMTRTFERRVFRLKEHVDRLYRSLKYVGIDPGMAAREMVAVSEDVLARNLHLLGPGEDFWLGQRISRGLRGGSAPTVIVECTPLPLKERARLYRDGIDVVVPSVRRVPPDSVSPRAKSHNYLNLVMAEREVVTHDPDAWAVLLDVNGNLAEGLGSNIFIVRDGKLFTPRERFVLPGVSRRAVMDLAAEAGIACEEKDLDLYDAYTADEVFLTSTSLCLCGVRTVNGQAIGDGKPPGPITKRLTEAYIRHVGCDFVKQYLDKLG
jgi:branched-chain amino acid aminotransferase